MTDTRHRDSDWLVVIDAQRVFAESGQPWFSPGFAEMADSVTRLQPLFGKRVVFTRFIPPAEPQGSWKTYYEKWLFARSSKDPIWDLAGSWADQELIIYDFPTFSKWSDPLRAHLANAHSVVLAGVSTDCCVLSTALAAIDEGVQVRVVTDACAASTSSLHVAALELLDRRAPQLTLSSVADEIHHQTKMNSR